MANGNTQLPSWATGGTNTKLPSWAQQVIEDTKGPAKPPHHHGVGGFFQNLGGDIKDATIGTVTGLKAVGEAVGKDTADVLRADYKTIKTGKVKYAAHPFHGKSKGSRTGQIASAVGKQYAQTYGPLFRGDFGQFAHNLYEHPLGPALDAYTIATLGAGAATKAGLLKEAARGYEISSPAVRAGQEGKVLTKPITGSELSRRTKIRYQQALDKLPEGTPLLGIDARYGRLLDRLPRQDALRLRNLPAKRAYDKATRNLTKEEFAALHWLGRGIHPTDYLAYLKTQGEKVEPTTLKALENKKVLKLVEHPTQKLLKANAAAHKLVAEMEDHKIGRGLLDEGSAVGNIARHQEAVEQALGRPLTAVAGLRHYVPDIRAASRKANLDIQRMGGGKGVPRMPGSTRRNNLVLFATGKIAQHADLIGPEYLDSIKYGLFHDIHDELMSSAVKSASQPHKGWVAIRRPVISKTGRERPERISHLRQYAADIRDNISQLHDETGVRQRAMTAAQIRSSIERGGPLPEGVPDVQAMGHVERPLESPEAPEKFYVGKGDEANALKDRDGNYLWVPKHLADQLAGEFTRSSSGIRNILAKPFTVWRALVLGLRVGFLTNNVVGNHLLYAIHAAGLNGLRAYLNAVKRVHGESTVRSLLKMKGIPEPLRQHFMDEFFPEQSHGSFGATQTEGLLGGKYGRKFRRVGGGLAPATQAVAENVLRRGLVETFIRRSPEFKVVYRALPKQARDFEAAAGKILSGEGGAEYQARISKQVDDALGNYLHMNKVEQHVLRNIIPFYSWYRAITRIAFHLAVDNPLRAEIISKLSQIGVQDTEKELANLFGGVVPDWAKGLLPLGGNRVASTSGANPFQTIDQEASGLGGLLGGKPGQTGKAFTEFGPNPYLLAAIQSLSGKDLFTGRDIKGGPAGLPLQVGAEIGGQLPQTQLIQALLGHGRESKTYGKQTGTEAILQYLGLPVKKVQR